MTDLISVPNFSELDALVAERLLGLEVFRSNGKHYLDETGNTILPRYSLDIAMAWKVVESCSSQGIQLQITDVGNNGGWQVKRVDTGTVNKTVGSFAREEYERKETSASHENVSTAICLAALKSIGTEIEWE